MSPTGAAFGDKKSTTTDPHNRPTLTHIGQLLRMMDSDPNSDVQREIARDPTHMLLYICLYGFQKKQKREHWKKRPTKKVNNRFRPPETNVAFRHGRLARPKNLFWPKRGSHPTEFRFDRCVFFPAACRTRFGGRNNLDWPKTALVTPICFYVGVFNPLYI